MKAAEVEPNESANEAGLCCIWCHETAKWNERKKFQEFLIWINTISSNAQIRIVAFDTYCDKSICQMTDGSPSELINEDLDIELVNH